MRWAACRITEESLSPLVLETQLLRRTHEHREIN